MKNKKKPFGASPSVLIVHDDEPKGFDAVIRSLVYKRARYLDEEQERAP